MVWLRYGLRSVQECRKWFGRVLNCYLSGNDANGLVVFWIAIYAGMTLMLE